MLRCNDCGGQAGAPTTFDEAPQWAPWKLKKRVAQILHRLQQRYGSPKRRAGAVNADGTARADADEILRFATDFQGRYAGKVLETSINLAPLRVLLGTS